MLTGEKIILRPVQFEDWEKTINWRNDLFIKASTMSHPFPVTAEMEKAWYDNVIKNKDNNYLPFTVVSKETKEVLGYFSLNNINWISRVAFVSGAIGNHQNFGKGLGREAVMLLNKYAFEYLNLNKVCAWVRRDHPAMKTWLDIGAVSEGTLRRHFFAEGSYHDVEFISWFREKQGQV